MNSLMQPIQNKPIPSPVIKTFDVEPENNETIPSAIPKHNLHYQLSRSQQLYPSIQE